MLPKGQKQMFFITTCNSKPFFGNAKITKTQYPPPLTTGASSGIFFHFSNEWSSILDTVLIIKCGTEKHFCFKNFGSISFSPGSSSVSRIFRCNMQTLLDTYVYLRNYFVAANTFGTLELTKQKSDLGNVSFIFKFQRGIHQFSLLQLLLYSYCYETRLKFWKIKKDLNMA